MKREFIQVGYIFHQPRFPWNKVFPGTSATFWGAQVVWGRELVWPAFMWHEHDEHPGFFFLMTKHIWKCHHGLYEVMCLSLYLCNWGWTQQRWNDHCCVFFSNLNGGHVAQSLILLTAGSKQFDPPFEEEMNPPNLGTWKWLQVQLFSSQIFVMFVFLLVKIHEGSAGNFQKSWKIWNFQNFRSWE